MNVSFMFKGIVYPKINLIRCLVLEISADLKLTSCHVDVGAILAGKPPCNYGYIRILHVFAPVNICLTFG